MAGASTPDMTSFGGNYWPLISQEIGGLAQSMPQLVKANQTNDASLAGITTTNLDRMLFGGPASTIGKGKAAVTTPASTGMVDMLNKAGSGLAAGSAATLAANGPAMMAAFNAANPQGAAETKMIGDTAMNDMSSGYNLTPGLFNNVDQAVKASGVGTLGGTGDSGAYEQALGMSQFGNQQYLQRLSNLQGAAGQNQNFYSGLIPGITGAASGASGAVGGAQSLVSGSTGGPFTPSVNYNDMINTNFNAASSTSMANTKATNDLIGSAIGAGSSAMKGAMSGSVGC